jgi:hypothetical protein
MKFKLNLSRVCLSFCAVVVILHAPSITLHAATNPPAAEVIQSNSSIVKDAQVYSIRFQGGAASEFFRFLSTNGFADDTILFAGDAGNVYIPRFAVRNVRLKEVAKSVEFVSEGKLNVEIVEQGMSSDVNIWRIKLAEPIASAQLKTKACAVPNLLTGTKAKDRVHQIVEEVYRALIDGAHEISRNEAQRPRGNIRILESEKIVVAVGAEAYVEAVASALEAAERVAAMVAAEKKKAAE